MSLIVPLGFIHGDRSWLLSIDITDAILLCDGCCHQDLTRFLHPIRVCSEGSNGSSNELWGFGIGQVEVVCGFHHAFRAYQSWIETDNCYMMLAQLMSHGRCHSVIGGLGGCIGDPFIITLRREVGNVDDQSGLLLDHYRR